MPNDRTPEGLSAVQDSPEPKNPLTLYEGKRDTDLVDEEIDERILNLLGLDDVFDIDYGTYKTLLRERLAQGRISGKELPRDEDELLVKEFRKIKGKTGRFKIKKKTISKGANVGVKSPIVKATKLLPSAIISEKGSDKSNDIKDIVKLLDSILSTLGNQSKEEKKRFDLSRRESEEKRRRLREGSLEKGFDKVKSAVSKIIAPFQSFLDKIQRFLFFTILGRAFKLFMDWAGDPKNKKKLESVGRFLKDWWPALLGAWFFFANPLGRFIRTIIGSVAKLTLRLAKFAIPKLLSFVKANPVAAAALAIGGTALLANEITGQRKAAPVQTENKAKAQSGKGLGMQGVGGVGDMGPTTPTGMLQGARSGGIIQKLDSGGNIFSGVVGKDDGTKVSGAGQDTQFFPVEGGGGAVLAPNELVLTEEQQAQIQKDTGVNPASYVAGIQPKKLSGNINPMSLGGIVGYNQGGIIGALSKILPGTGTVMAPKGMQWEGQGTTLQKLLGMTVPGSERTTTYSPSDIGRYNQLNKLRQLLSGDAMYSGSSGRYMARMTKTQPNQETFVQDAFRNFGKNVNTIKGAAKRQEEMMGQMGYKPDGYVNLSGRPIKRQGGGIVNALKSIEQVLHGKNYRPRYRSEVNNFMMGSGSYRPNNFMMGSSLYNVYNVSGSQGPRSSIIKENTGYDKPGAGADRQYLPPMMVQPGEAHYIIPKDAVQRGAIPKVDQIVAKLDPNSNPKKSGADLVGPPVKNNFIPLPPEIIKSSSAPPSYPASGSESVPTFSAYRKTDERRESLKIYTLRSSMIGSRVM